MRPLPEKEALLVLAKIKMLSLCMLSINTCGRKEEGGGRKEGIGKLIKIFQEPPLACKLEKDCNSHQLEPPSSLRGLRLFSLVC